VREERRENGDAPEGRRKGGRKGHLLNRPSDAKQGEEETREERRKNEDEAEGGRGLGNVPPELVLAVVDEVDLGGREGGREGERK